MRVSVCQVYIEVGVRYLFSHRFQVHVSDELSKLVSPSIEFVERYGADYNIVINMSAKSGIERPEVHGPAVYRKTKDIEYTVFLPFDKQKDRNRESYRCALRQLLDQIGLILAGLEIDVSRLSQSSEAIVDGIVDDTRMFRVSEDRDS